jgi:hypothetical protein
MEVNQQGSTCRHEQKDRRERMEKINNERVFGIVDYVSAEADKITRGKLSHHDVLSDSFPFRMRYSIWYADSL